jgi:16S rRNA (cytosine967-C5)-methyltransferase
VDSGEKPVPEELHRNLSARDAALEALARVEEGAGLLRDELHDLFEHFDLAPRDRGLALQLAAGAIRHRRTLRLIVSRLRGGRGREGTIQPPLRRILELGAFQLLFLDRVPAYAVVNEAVQAARRTAGKPHADKAAGFVNGVLRGLVRLIAGRDPEGRPARDALPHPEGGVVRLKEAVLPDPKESRAAYLGAAYSFPDWLAARWLAAFGERAEEICRWSNRRPRVFARVNPMGKARLAPGECAVGPRAGSIDVSAIEQERLDALLAEGALTVQDPSAMLAVEALAPAPGESVLDLCASPGTKTTQIVEAMGDRGRVVACDRREDKLVPIRETVAARRLESVRVCATDELAAAAPPGGFDAALVDAPCSNTGVLARRAEVRWRLRPDDLEELPRIQGGVLARAAGLVRPGGRLVYSTCSLQREENDGVIARFLEGSAGWRLVRSDLILPGGDHDGGFLALLAH